MNAYGQIAATYRRMTPGSSELAHRASVVLPGGDTRASGWFAPYPLALVRGAGTRVWDVDGNEYLDLLGNYTSLVHGNSYPPIVESVRRVAAEGSAYATANPYQVELAELLVARVDSVEQVRFVNSGTEAAMLAMQVAKLATGRPRILMARHGYHGSHEDTKAGTFAGTREEALFGGADGQSHETLVAPYGDAEAFERLLADRGDEIAAVFCEPVQGSGAFATGSSEFFRRVAEACRVAGAVFVLDEVITFRLAPGGAQETLGVRPDLTMFGKLIGGGYPVGAVGGRSDLLALTRPRTGVLSHSGTFNGNPVTTAAGAVAVRELTAERIDRMGDLALRLEERIRKGAAGAGLPCSVRRVGSLLLVAIVDAFGTGLLREADPRTTALHLAAATHGVHISPRGLVALSTVHTEQDIDEAGERLARALDDVARTSGDAPSR